MRSIGLAAPAALCLLLAPAASARQERGAIEAVWGVTPSGEPTDEWLTLLRRRLADAPYREAAGLRKPATVEETRWADLIRSRLPVWESRRESMAALYRPAPPPARVRIILGNRGTDDAFTHDAVTIGFDLSALQAVYGSADRQENHERIDRLFHHEFTHLMQKAWLVDHPWTAGTPLREALLDIWLEGIGNHHSLSQRWRSIQGAESAASREARERLEPRLVARLSALACAPAEQAERLLAGLSRGPFDQKWGALTMALWLEREAAGDPEALRRFVVAGPDGFWDLAARNLPAPLGAVLAEARAAASVCAGG
jgi:hypothetical protein